MARLEGVVVVAVVDWRSLMDSSLDERVLETLEDDHHDRLSHLERTSADEEADGNLRFDRTTKRRSLEISEGF